MIGINLDFLEADSKVSKFCLLTLTVLAVFYTLYAAKDLLLPVALALLIRFMLMPTLRAAKRLTIPHSVSAALITIGFVALLYTGASTLATPAQAWLEVLPSKISVLEQRLRSWQLPLTEVSKTASQIEVLTDWDKQKAPQVSLKSDSILQNLFTGGQVFFSSLAITFILLYFLLVYGDDLIAATARLFTDNAQFEGARTLASDIEKAVSRYLWTITVINVSLSLVVMGTMYLLGMPNPVLWGVLAGVLNYIPYIGPLILIILLSVVSLTSYTTATVALLPPLLFFVITSVEGSILTPLILGKRFTLNPIIVFTWVVLWAWLWGSVGGLMAVPILVTLNIIIAKLFTSDPQIFLVPGGRNVEAPATTFRNTSALVVSTELS